MLANTEYTSEHVLPLAIEDTGSSFEVLASEPFCECKGFGGGCTRGDRNSLTRSVILDLRLS